MVPKFEIEILELRFQTPHRCPLGWQYVVLEFSSVRLFSPLRTSVLSLESQLQNFNFELRAHFSVFQLAIINEPNIVQYLNLYCHLLVWEKFHRNQRR
eukprot:sb/3478888/